MKAAADLHIHTALSPCSDNDMTPNNIVNMALLKGLDIIAVTDHNSAGNCEAVCRCALGKGLVVVPGIEVETREEVHVLCYFPDPHAAMMMQKHIYAALPSIDNREDIFGQQIILDEKDAVKGYVKQLLLTAANLGIEEVFSMARSLRGVAVPAHIDREAYSILSNLGLIPGDLSISALEISQHCDIVRLTASYPGIGRYRLLRSSDAHSLGSIAEREFLIELDELSAEGLIRALSG